MVIATVIGGDIKCLRGIGTRKTDTSWSNGAVQFVAFHILAHQSVGDGIGLGEGQVCDAPELTTRARQCQSSITSRPTKDDYSHNAHGLPPVVFPPEQHCGRMAMSSSASGLPHPPNSSVLPKHSTYVQSKANPTCALPDVITTLRTGTVFSAVHVRRGGSVDRYMGCGGVGVSLGLAGPYGLGTGRIHTAYTSGAGASGGPCRVKGCPECRRGTAHVPLLAPGLGICIRAGGDGSTKCRSGAPCGNRKGRAFETSFRCRLATANKAWKKNAASRISASFERALTQFHVSQQKVYKVYLKDSELRQKARHPDHGTCSMVEAVASVLLNYRFAGEARALAWCLQPIRCEHAQNQTVKTTKGVLGLGTGKRWDSPFREDQKKFGRYRVPMKLNMLGLSSVEMLTLAELDIER
ncbi:hypothetical protein EDC04DRAFT_3088745, partial [Pisolithus marmoratus]